MGKGDMGFPFVEVNSDSSQESMVKALHVFSPLVRMIPDGISVMRRAQSETIKAW